MGLIIGGKKYFSFWGLKLSRKMFLPKFTRKRQYNKLELSSAKLRRLMKLSWKKFDEMIFDRLEAILKDS